MVSSAALSYNRTKNSYEFDESKIQFDAPRKNAPMPRQGVNSSYGMNISRMFINYQYPNGSRGPLVLKTPEMYSYGIKKFDSNDVNDVNAVPSYSLSLVTYDSYPAYSSGPTPHEKAFIDAVDKITAVIKAHLEKSQVFNSWKGHDVNVMLLDIFNRENDKAAAAVGGVAAAPKLYCKLKYSYKDNVRRTDTRFVDRSKARFKREMDIEELTDARFRCNAAILISDVFCMPGLIKVRVMAVDCKVRSIVGKTSYLTDTDDDDDDDEAAAIETDSPHSSGDEVDPRPLALPRPLHNVPSSQQQQ